MSQTREYVVTLRRKEDLDSFYHDMEHKCDKDCIPSRQVEVANRRPISRNTHYWLTDEEAVELSNDPRVASITLTMEELGIEIVPYGFIQDGSNWSKSWVGKSTDLNWGLLRCYKGENTVGWGHTPDNTSVTNLNGKIDLANTGRNVDVVIMDGLANPNHPEYARNPDGTGGSRLIQFNWWQYTPQVSGKPAGVYPYNSVINATDADTKGKNDHGTHVAGTVAGITQGWAKHANIYNIFAYGAPAGEYKYDYVRLFHKNKPINPVTKRKNPTIVNMSFGLELQISASEIGQINYRGSLINKPSGGWSKANLLNYGLVFLYNNPNSQGSGGVPTIYQPDIADIHDAMDEGVIFIAASGNSSTYICRPGDIDYNNYVKMAAGRFATTPFPQNPFGNTLYYHRGASPGSIPRVICVGSVSNSALKLNGAFSKLEEKADYSCTGPRIDIYSPGTGIISAVAHPSSRFPFSVKDPRNAGYLLVMMQGTSMASPQVCGVMACVLEANPGMKQEDVLEYIKNNSENGALYDIVGNMTYSNDQLLLGGPNRYLKYKIEKKDEIDTGIIYPKNNFNMFKKAKIVYPKPNIRRKG